jgi:hypothetical protein
MIYIIDDCVGVHSIPLSCSKDLKNYRDNYLETLKAHCASAVHKKIRIVYTYDFFDDESNDMYIDVNVDTYCHVIQTILNMMLKGYVADCHDALFDLICSLADPCTIRFT